MDNDLKYLMDEIKADQKPVKPKRRKRRRRSGAFLILFLFVLILVLVAGGILFWWKSRPERKLPGGWHRTIDLAAEAGAAAKEWLMDAEGGRAIDMKTYMGSVTVGVDLTLAADGSWTCTVDENSYRMAEQQAYTALEQALEDLLLARAQEAGQEMTGREEAAQSIEDTIGMSCREYLRTYGPVLLPALEELRAEYEGSGDWKAESGVLLRNGSGEAFLINTDLLVLTGSDGTEVYYRNAE